MKNPTIVKGKEDSNLTKDFFARVDKYSSLGWKNRKGLSKSKVSGQVPAFAINFFSKTNLLILKNHPKAFQELSKVNLAFQYIKYRPKESLRLYSQEKLRKAKYHARGINIARKGKGLKPFKLPTSASLGLKEQSRVFKENYPKILKRKRDGSIDTIKSDWNGYLVAFIPGNLSDGEVLGSDFFFKTPALFWASNKEEIINKINKRTRKILEAINLTIKSFMNGSEDDYKRKEGTLLKLAFSLTPQGIMEKIEEEKRKEIEEELNKTKIKARDVKMEVDWDDFE
jgi:hypothetical protein